MAASTSGFWGVDWRTVLAREGARDVLAGTPLERHGKSLGLSIICVAVCSRTA